MFYLELLFPSLVAFTALNYFIHCLFQKEEIIATMKNKNGKTFELIKRKEGYKVREKK